MLRNFKLSNLKLRTKLLAILLVTGLIPLIVFSSVSTGAFLSTSRKDTYLVNEDKLEIVKSKIEGMLDKHFTTLLTIANQSAVRNFELDEVKSILVDAARVNPDLLLCLDNNQGDQLVKSNDDSLTNVSERDFFQKAIKGTEKYVSDVILAKTTGKLMVVISTPVRDINANIVGVLQANIQLGQLSDYVAELSQDGSNVYILSRQKTVLAHPNEEYVQNQEDFSSLNFASEYTGENTTLQTKNINGENVIVSYCSNDLAGWLIAVERPVKTAMSSIYRLLNIYMVMFAVVIIVIVVASQYFSKLIAKPFITLSTVMRTIADGELKDYDIKIKSNDEIGQVYQSFKVMNQNLRSLVGNIQLTAGSLASQSLQLSSATDQTSQSLTQVVTTISEMAQGNSDQASMVQTTTDTISRVNDIVSDATEKTETAADKAQETLNLAIDGQDAIKRQSQKIVENNKYTNAVGESIQQLAAMADEIRNIVGVINNIANQTNLLSLNASIEAARAGDAGRGFAVVAEEIRKLAEQSGSSAGKIEDLVKSINGKIQETVVQMNQAKDSVISMEASADDTKKSFDRILGSVTDLAQIVKDVNIAFEEISEQVEEVAKQAIDISAVVEEASAGMEEISASSEEQLAAMETISNSSEELKNMANDLLTQVSKFKISE